MASFALQGRRREHYGLALANPPSDYDADDQRAGQSHYQGSRSEALLQRLSVKNRH